MNKLIFDFGYFQMSYWEALIATIITVVSVGFSFSIKKHSKEKRNKIYSNISIISLWIISLTFLLMICIPAFNKIELLRTDYLIISSLNLITILVLFVFNIFIRKILKSNFLTNKFDEDLKSLNIFIFLIDILSIHFILKMCVINYDKLLAYNLFTIKEVGITIADIIYIIVIITLTILLLFMLRFILKRQVKRNKLEVSTSTVLLNISKYFIWTISIAFIIQTIGFNLSILLAGSAALMVGIGLGIQQLFNDFASGLILLVERQLKVGDYIEADTISGTIQEIGFRTTNVLTQNNISVIIPNSRLVSSSVINWSKGEKYSRFEVIIGVAYGTNTDKVKQILLECAKNHKSVLETPAAEVQFIDFGASSLDFKLYFYSDNPYKIERIKSELRFTINSEFLKQNIEIPFPQVDVNFRNQLKLDKKTN